MEPSLFKQYQGVFSEKPEQEKKEAKKEREYAYSPFALQDAVGERNIKKIWIEYHRLRYEGIEAEDLIHKIISKVKDMVAIISGATSADLGVKDYPFNKSKKDLKNWKEADLKKFYEDLVSVYHQSRMGNYAEELNISLERLVLSL